MVFFKINQFFNLILEVHFNLFNDLFLHVLIIIQMTKKILSIEKNDILSFNLIIKLYILFKFKDFTIFYKIILYYGYFFEKIY